MDTEKQRQRRRDDARLTEGGNARSEQLNTRSPYRVANRQQSLACLSGSELVSFPDPTNPSADRFQYHDGEEGLVTFVMFSCLNGMCNYGISRANKQRHLDLAQGLALFALIRPYLKSCCLPAPSVAAAISPFFNGL